MHAIRLFAFVALLIFCVAAPADAATSGSAYTTKDGISTRANKTETQLPRSTSVSTIPQPVCTYHLIDESPTAVFSTPAGEVVPMYDSTHPSTAGAWQWRECTDPTTGNQTINTVWVAKANPSTLAQEALSEQVLPAFEIFTNPPLPGGAVVNFPTWLWVNVGDWRPVTATASVDGLSVTANAAPVSVIWNMGDGTSVTCHGPGMPYDPNKPDTSQQSDCTHVFLKSSANQPNHAYAVTASVQWNSTWQASDGTSGSLDPMTRSTMLSTPVREIQAINVAPAGGQS